MAYDVFISYSRKDAEIVNRIEEELKKHNIDSFVDRSEIDLGDDFAEVIAKSLYESEILLFIWSESSNQSENTANEIALAIDFEKTIIPFKIGMFKPHYKLAYRLVRFNRIDATTFNEPQIIELGEKIAKRLGKTPAIKKQEIVQESTVIETSEVTLDNPLFETFYQLGKQALSTFNINTAFSELLEPALNNYKDSQILLSRIVQSKTRIWKVDENQFNTVLKEADKGNSFAQYIMASYYNIRKCDRANTFLYARKAVEQNSSYGMVLLADCYDLGLGVEKDNNRYAELIRKAVSMDNQIAILNMAKNSLHGWTVKVDIERGLKLLEKGVNLGSLECLTFLGDLYWEGTFVPQDIEKAKEYINKAILQGYIEGYRSLGDIYMYKPIVYEVLDAQKGFQYYMKGAEYSEANCLTAIAQCYYYGHAVKEDAKNAMKWFQKAANAGDRNAYFFIGCIYYYGEGVPENNKLAWNWFSKGYEMVYSSCAFMLGTMCLEGNAPEGEEKDTVKYFEESAFLGGNRGEEAMLKLYDIYTEGTLVDRDEEKAMTWLQRAANMKNPKALLKYGILLTDINSPYSDEFKGAKYLQQALDKDVYDAALYLSRLYRQGVGGMMDRDKAKELLRIAAEKGNNIEAYCELGKLYSHANQSEWDDEKEEVDDVQKEKDNCQAMQYFEKAAEQNYAEAYIRMAEIEQDRLDFDNLTTCKSAKKCFEWTKKAAELGYPQALLDMGVNYQIGIGTSVDVEKSIEWYQRSYEKGNKYAPFNIAELYNDGELVSKDMTKAKYWYKEALKLNNESAKEKLEKIDC